MPFDPSASFTVVEEPPEQSSGFDPSKPFTVVEESPSFQPAIPAPGESGQSALAPARAPITQAFPTGIAEREAATKEPSLTMEEAEQMLMTPNVTIPNPIPESWPRTRGVVNVLKTIPEMATSGAGPLILGAQLVPGLREPVDAVLGASMLKAGSQMAGEASVTKDKEKMAEAITTAGLGALALGGTLARPQVAPAIANEIAARRVGRPDITAADLAARRASGVRDAAGLPVEPARVPAVTPGTLLKRADAELKELTGERTTDAVPKRETEAVPVEEPPRGGTQVVEEVRQQARPDDAPAKEATPETQRDVAAPPTEAQAAVAAEQPFVRLEPETPKPSSEPIGGKEVPKPAEPTPAEIESAIFEAMSEHVIGIDKSGKKEGSYVMIPPEAGEGWQAIGPFKTRDAAETFLESEVGAPGAKVVDVGLKQQAVSELRAPEMVGMGGAVPSEFVPKGQTATGIKNAAIEADRLARGEEPLFSKARESNQVTWERTMAQIDRDPGWQDRLIAELKETPRNISDIEEVALMHRLTDLKNEYAKATRDAEQAYSDGRMQDVAQAQERIADWQSKLAELERVARDVGTEWGKSGQMRQRLMREDFTLEAMERQFREAKGFEPLTESERAQVKRQHDELQAKIKTLEERVGQKERQLTDAETARVMAELKAQAAAAPKYEPRVLKVAEDFASFMDEKAASALSRIKEKLRQVGAAPDPTLLADVAIYGAAKITRGLVDFAKWSDEMVREVGDWIKPHLDQAWKDSQKLFQADLDRFAKPLGKMAADIKKAVTDGAKAKPIEKIAAQIKVRAEANDLAGVGRLAKRLAREFVIEGIREWKPLVEAVHAKIKEVIPEFTLGQARDAISGYGDYTQLAKDEISVILRDLKGQMQQIGKLEDMAAGKAPRKTGMERRTPSDEERRLIKQVNEAKKKGGFKVTDPATQLRTALQAIKTRLENQIKDLSFQITNKTKMVKERRSVAYDSEAQALKRKRDELKEQYDAMFPKEPITDAQRLANWKTRAQKRIKELNERIANKDFEPRKRKPIELDKEAFKIELQIEEIKRKFNEELVNQRMARRDRWSKIFGGAAEGINTTRSLLTSADVSAVLRQGGFIAFGHPLRAAKSVPEMLKALVSKEAAAAVEAKIRLRDNYQLYRQSGLELTEQGHSLVKMEEAFMSRLAGKLPFGVGKLVEGSQRAYTTFLNLLRADSFDAMVRTLSRDGRTVTPVEAKIIANFVNVATGRGQIGAKANMAAGLNTVFFAPRFVASRFQLALGQPIWHGIASGGKIPFKDTAKVRRMIAWEYGRFLMGAGFVYALGSVLGGEIEMDPRSSDFAKLKFGNTRIDLLGGLQQVSVFTSRSISGSTKTGGGRVLPIRGELPYGAKSWADVAGRFARTKFSPVFGTMVDVLTGKNVVEEPTTVGSVVQRLTIPISFQEVGTLMEEQGFPKGFSMFLLSLFGAGVQTYEER